jgi:hypothetical protein
MSEERRKANNAGDFRCVRKGVCRVDLVNSNALCENRRHRTSGWSFQLRSRKSLRSQAFLLPLLEKIRGLYSFGYGEQLWQFGREKTRL